MDFPSGYLISASLPLWLCSWLKAILAGMTISGSKVRVRKWGGTKDPHRAVWGLSRGGGGGSFEVLVLSFWGGKIGGTRGLRLPGRAGGGRLIDLITMGRGAARGWSAGVEEGNPPMKLAARLLRAAHVWGGLRRRGVKDTEVHRGLMVQGQEGLARMWRFAYGWRAEGRGTAALRALEKLYNWRASLVS